MPPFAGGVLPSTMMPGAGSYAEVPSAATCAHQSPQQHSRAAPPPMMLDPRTSTSQSLIDRMDHVVATLEHELAAEVQSITKKSHKDEDLTDVMQLNEEALKEIRALRRRERQHLDELVRLRQTCEMSERKLTETNLRLRELQSERAGVKSAEVARARRALAEGRKDGARMAELERELQALKANDALSPKVESPAQGASVSQELAAAVSSQRAREERLRVERLEWDLTNSRKAEASSNQQVEADRARITELENRLTEVTAAETKIAKTAQVAADRAARQIDQLERDLVEARAAVASVRHSSSRTEMLVRERDQQIVLLQQQVSEERKTLALVREELDAARLELEQLSRDPQENLLLAPQNVVSGMQPHELDKERSWQDQSSSRQAQGPPHRALDSGHYFSNDFDQVSVPTPLEPQKFRPKSDEWQTQRLQSREHDAGLRVTKDYGQVRSHFPQEPRRSRSRSDEEQASGQNKQQHEDTHRVSNDFAHFHGQQHQESPQSRSRSDAWEAQEANRRQDDAGMRPTRKSEHVRTPFPQESQWSMPNSDQWQSGGPDNRAKNAEILSLNNDEEQISGHFSQEPQWSMSRSDDWQVHQNNPERDVGRLFLNYESGNFPQEPQRSMSRSDDWRVHGQNNPESDTGLLPSQYIAPKGAHFSQEPPDEWQVQVQNNPESDADQLVLNNNFKPEGGHFLQESQWSMSRSDESRAHGQNNPDSDADQLVLNSNFEQERGHFPQEPRWSTSRSDEWQAFEQNNSDHDSGDRPEQQEPQRARSRTSDVFLTGSRSSTSSSSSSSGSLDSFQG